MSKFTLRKEPRFQIMKLVRCQFINNDFPMFERNLNNFLCLLETANKVLTYYIIVLKLVQFRKKFQIIQTKEGEQSYFSEKQCVFLLGCKMCIVNRISWKKKTAKIRYHHAKTSSRIRLAVNFKINQYDKRKIFYVTLLDSNNVLGHSFPAVFLKIVKTKK